MRPLRQTPVQSGVFTRILHVNLPEKVIHNPANGKSQPFSISFTADGEVPFPQIIIRANAKEYIFNYEKIKAGESFTYIAQIPETDLPAGTQSVQIEGCRRKDWQQSSGDDWIKTYSELHVVAENVEKKETAVRQTAVKKKIDKVLYFAIHKHMHQPFYRAADTSYWDGEKDSIFSSRGGNYTTFIPNAVNQYIAANLPHAGMSTSWSGSLIEQLERCSKEHLCGGRFTNWNNSLRALSDQKTCLDNQRVSFSAFGYFHPLMPLIPQRDIVKQILSHRDLIRKQFKCKASDILFPPETAFHVRMIPALKKAGIRAVIYDSIHRYRACKDYPYAGINEGMLPPNQADQVNPPVNDWLQLQNVWAGSKISPCLLKPEYIEYEDVDGSKYKIIGVPAERYIGNEDARGGFGALQYEHVLGQVYDSLMSNNNFDPKHPPFFVLHSDGDNHGGGADSYYNHNTAQLINWIKGDPRFELTTIEDYLALFPPDEKNTVHIEPGSWSGADNGDPQFKKWFSCYNDPYSPDLNSWAVLTALQNVLHTMEDNKITSKSFEAAERLLLTAETSCYWYWTGQEIWDRQVTDAANLALSLVGNECGNLKDTTAPTIFPPWITPENPGGKQWGQGCLKDAQRTATVHTFIYDISDIKNVELVLRNKGNDTLIPMKSHGAYPSKTNALKTATYYTAELPEGEGNVRYFIRATDKQGNTGSSSLERIFLA